MAESMARPWILNYLRGIAETRGANIHDAPPLKEKRKVQITRFLTKPPNNQPNNIIWALISDKHYEVPAKFTADAITAYNRENGVLGVDEDESRLTTRRFVLVIVNDVKAFFARVPLGSSKGMSDAETIALEVGAFRVLGADHEGIFGDPANIESHEDIQEWIAGLKEGGGGGNVLKRSNGEVPLLKTSPAKQQTIRPAEGSSRPEKAQDAEKQADVAKVSEHARVTALFSLVKEGQPNSAAEFLKEYNRQMKMVYRIPYAEPSPETQLQLDQILVFGRDLLPASKRKLATQELTVHSAGTPPNGDSHDESVPMKQGSEMANPAACDSHPSVNTPPPSPTKIDNTGKSVPTPTTPSVWEDSGDEQEGQGGDRDKDPGDSSPFVALPTPRHTSSPAAQPSAESDENMTEDEDDELADSDKENYEEADRNERRSDFGEEGEAETCFPTPTPAQRPRRNSGTDPSMVQSPFKPSQPQSSDWPPTSGWPSSLLIPAFPYHTSPKNSLLPRASLISELSHAQHHTQSQSQPQSWQSQFDTSSQERPVGSTPRILVPDSDASGRLNSQSHCQSQSQSRSQPQPSSPDESSVDSQSHHKSQQLPSHDSQKYLSRPLQGSSPVRPVLRNRSSQVHSEEEKRVPLSPSRSINQSLPRPQSDDHRNKRRVHRKFALPERQQSTTMTDPQELAESHPRLKDDDITKPPSKPHIADGIPKYIADHAPLAAPSNPIHDEKGQSLSSVTQEDSQQSRTQESSLDQVEASNTSVQSLVKAEPTVPLDADDARTYEELFGGLSEAADTVKNSGHEVKRNIIQDAREAHRLSHVQDSPTTHLGKHSLCSSQSLDSINSAAIDSEEGNARKKARVSPPIDGEALAKAEKGTLHDRETWQAPTFLRRREEKSKSASNDIDSREQDKGRDKGKERVDNTANRNEAITQLEQRRTLSRNESSVARPDSVNDKGKKRCTANGSESSRNTTSSNSTSRLITTSRKTGQHVRDAQRITSGVPSSSHVKIEDTDECSTGSLLGGFTSDLTLHREPGGPQWYTLQDLFNILYDINNKQPNRT